MRSHDRTNQGLRRSRLRFDRPATNQQCLSHQQPGGCRDEDDDADDDDHEDDDDNDDDGDGGGGSDDG